MENLLYDLCVEWGFCLTPESYQSIATTHAFTPEEFAEAILRAEGKDPAAHEAWMNRLSGRFREHFSTQASSPAQNNI